MIALLMSGVLHLLFLFWMKIGFLFQTFNLTQFYEVHYLKPFVLLFIFMERVILILSTERIK